MSNHIKKIALKTVEERLGLELNRNLISLGWDVAGHETGIALMRTTDSYLILERTHKIKVPKKITEMDTIDLFIEQLDSFKNEISQQYKLDKNIIENCFFGRNVNTLKLLARCGILVYDRFRGLSKTSELIMPMSSRSKVGFKKSHKNIKGLKLKKEVVNFINNLLEIDIKDNDICDAIVLALNGFIK